MKKISIYFDDFDDLETALKDVVWNGYRMKFEDVVNENDCILTIKSDNGAVRGWVVIYMDNRL